MRTENALGIGRRARIMALGALAITFTIGLTYSAIALPRALASAMDEAFELIEFDAGADPYGSVAVAESSTLRWMGRVSLLIVGLLVVIGLIAERTGAARAGAVVFFLPVFGHFAAGMFFLAGIAALRVAWLPLLHISHDILRLGDVSFLPYAAVVYAMALIGLDCREVLVWLLMGIGMSLFVLGTSTWLYVRMRGRGVANLWVYRLSRHPQYAGWIIWSYGFMIYSMLHSQLGLTRVNYGMASSLPWLVSTMVIIGVAMLEELRMRRERAGEYEEYSRQTSFMLPLPRFIGSAIAYPSKLLFKSKGPRNGSEVALLVATYLGILILLSVPFVVFDWPPGGQFAGSHTGWWSFPFNVPPFR